MNVLVLTEGTPAHYAMLRQAVPEAAFHFTSAPTPEEIAQAEVIFGNPAPALLAGPGGCGCFSWKPPGRIRIWAASFPRRYRSAMPRGRTVPP